MFRSLTQTMHLPLTSLPTHRNVKSTVHQCIQCQQVTAKVKLIPYLIMSSALSQNWSQTRQSATGDFPPSLWLPFQPNSVPAPWPVPNYTVWWHRHMDVNNLPRVAAQQCPTGSQTRQTDHKTMKLTEFLQKYSTVQPKMWLKLLTGVLALGFHRLNNYVAPWQFSASHWQKQTNQKAYWAGDALDLILICWFQRHIFTMGRDYNGKIIV